MTTKSEHERARGRYIVLAGCIALLLCVMLSRRSLNGDHPSVEDHPTTSIIPSKQRAATTAIHTTPSNDSTDPYLQLLGETFPPEAQRVLVSAIKCAMLIEQERRAFARNTPGDRLLEGLQRKLFLDDYAYAALLSDQVDGARAALSFEKLSREMQQLSAIPPPSPSSKEGRPFDPATSQRMQDKYLPMLQSPNLGYSNVFYTISEFDPHAMTTDMFKDALSYVGLRTEVKQWMDEAIKDGESILTELRLSIPDPERLRLAISGHERLSAEKTNGLARVQDAFATVFSFRATENHGLDGESVIQSLNHLNLSGTGPELTIPVR